MKNEPRGCELVQQAIDGAGDDVEFKNQIAFYAARCSPASSTTATTAAPLDTAKPATPPPASAPAAAKTYAVQVLAVKSAAQVDDMLTRLKVMGFAARAPRAAAKTSAGRVLAVKRRAQVDDMLTRLKVMGFDARVVRDSAGFFKVHVGQDRKSTRLNSSHTDISRM